MAEFLQAQFDEFHGRIKLDRVDDYQALREKRDMLIQELRDWCKANQKPGFDDFSQGSYDICTGIVPLVGEDFDIDTGLEFQISISKYEDPTEVKQWVIDAFSLRPNRTVESKTPCVRVQYLKEGEPKFHIDFAVYGRKDVSKPGIDLYLAVGKPGAKSENKKWDTAEPFALKGQISGKFSEAKEREQMRRCIRYLKRWKDNKFSEGRPTGIALTAMALNWFTPKVKDTFTGKEKISDFEALKSLVDQIYLINYGLDVRLPLKPYNDLFAKIKANQTHENNYKERLGKLRQSLIDAAKEPDPHDAAEILQKQFGKDFPVPLKEETAKRTSAPAIAPSIGSA